MFGINKLKKMEKLRASKVYHINIIFRMRTENIHGEEQIFYKKVRVVLDQKGIKRVVEPAFTLED